MLGKLTLSAGLTAPFAVTVPASNQEARSVCVTIHAGSLGLAPGGGGTCPLANWLKDMSTKAASKGRELGFASPRNVAGVNVLRLFRSTDFLLSPVPYCE